jgi:hypothetical protein
MTHTPSQIEIWIADLLDEAKRDIVFLWNIQRGSYGGLFVAPDKKTLEKVIEGLVRGGCLVGFGDPSFPTWSVPSDLQVSRELLPTAIVQFWEANPKQNEFITFALR